MLCLCYVMFSVCLFLSRASLPSLQFTRPPAHTWSRSFILGALIRYFFFVANFLFYQAVQTLLKVDALNATGQATGPVTVGGPQDPTPAMALIRQDLSMLGEEEEDSLDRQQTMLSDEDGFFDSLAEVKEQYEFPINDSTCVKGKLRENVNFYSTKL